MISAVKLSALTEFKVKELFKNKTFIISLFLVPGITLAMKLLYQSIIKGEIPSSLLAMVLNLGVLYNLNAIALMMPATMMAKDKEKNTLRTLMTSSVTGIEYFISAIVPTFLVSALLNVVVLLISGIAPEINVPLYLLVTSLASLTSCIIGMIVGLHSKNQMSSSNISTVVMMIFMIIPMFGGMVERLQKVSDFLYTGIVSSMINSFANGEKFSMNLWSWAVLIGEILIAIGIFIACYKVNGFDKD